MMFSTLRSRLWLSYALVTGAALSVVAIVLLIYIIQNPSTYRQANSRLTIVAAFLRKNEPEWIGLASPDLQVRIEQADNVYSTRIAIYGAKSSIDQRFRIEPAASSSNCHVSPVCGHIPSWWMEMEITGFTFCAI